MFIRLIEASWQVTIGCGYVINFLSPDLSSGQKNKSVEDHNYGLVLFKCRERFQSAADNHIGGNVVWISIAQNPDRRKWF